MSTAEKDIRTVTAQYCAVYPQAKQKVTLSVHADGNITLFIGSPDIAGSAHAQGEGKTLDEAAAALKAHLARRLEAVKAKDVDDLNKAVAFRTKFHSNIDAALATLTTPEAPAPE
jgi:hypothetical protein